jgi:hypothetical protein
MPEVASGERGSSNPKFGDPSDHDEVVGHLAIAYFGISQVPIGSQAGASDTVSAPAIGVRYWLNERFGIDVGLGFGFSSSGGTAYAPNSADVDLAGPGRFAMLLHGGLPISMYHGGHYNLLIIPELNIGFSSGIDDADASTTTDDILLSGFMLEIGARAGAEWHLEVLDIPQATLQVTVGLGLGYEHRNVENDAGAGRSFGTFGISTIGADLGDLLSSSVQVMLYL